MGYQQSKESDIFLVGRQTSKVELAIHTPNHGVQLNAILYSKALQAWKHINTIYIHILIKF